MVRLSVPRLFILVLFGAIFTMAVKPPVDTDTWWHLAAGRLMWQTGQIPRRDVFSHTAFGKTWIDHSWLAQLILYGLHRLGGPPALALGAAALITLSLALIYLLMDAPARVLPGWGVYLRGFGLLLVALASSVMWVARPLLFTLVFFSAVMVVLRRGESAPKALWALPGLFVLWGNLHGGYAAGLILLAAYGVGFALDLYAARRDPELWRYRELRRLAGVFLACVVALLLNPFGYRLLLYPLFTVGVGPLREYIQEWASPDFHQLFLHPFIWLLLALAGAMGFSPRPPRWRELIPAGVFLYLALVASRNIPLFALAAGPLLARSAAEALKGRMPPLRAAGPSALNTALLVLLAGVMLVRIGLVLSPASLSEAERRSLPAGAVDFVLRENPQGEMFNDYDWGGYLIWRMYPRYRVFADGRTTLYGEEILGEYLTVALGKPGWDEILRKYDVGFAVLKTGSMAARWLESRPGWCEVYRDEVAVVLSRCG